MTNIRGSLFPVLEKLGLKLREVILYTGVHSSQGIYNEKRSSTGEDLTQRGFKLSGQLRG